MKLLSGSAAIVYLACVTGGACAADQAEREAIAMAERGAALIKAKGKEEMMKRIHAHDPDFFQGALSMDMRDLYTGIVLADAANPALAGKALAQGPEANSPYPRQVIELAQRDGKGWIATPYRDPASGRNALKTTYVLRVDDVVLQADIRRQQ
jgi:cytochrome c